jgi:hypothetical protein
MDSKQSDPKLNFKKYIKLDGSNPSEMAFSDSQSRFPLIAGAFARTQ